MTFKKSGFTVTAFQMVGTFTIGKTQTRYGPGHWIVIGWQLNRLRVVMTDSEFQWTFNHSSQRSAA